MKEFCNKHKRLLIDIAVLVGTFLFILLSYFIFKPLYSTSSVKFGSIDGIIPRIYIIACIFVIALVGIILRIKNKLTIEVVLFLAFLLGVVLQLNYMLITPYNYRQHDVFSYNAAGHEGYALTIYKTGQLPTQVDSNGYLDYQFYHPPLNAFMQAALCISVSHLWLYIT